MNDNTYAERLEELRAAMRREGADALIIPTGDYHGSEYVAPCFRLRAHYSGFTGSAGTLAVFADDEALLWTDGRYFIQAERELEGSGITLMRSGEPGVPSMNAYLSEHLPAGSVLAFDGRCITAEEGMQLQKALRRSQVTIRADIDIAGGLWKDRPSLPSNPVRILDAHRYAGEDAASKLARLREAMSKEGATAFVSGKLDEIMWLYNLRGNDVACNPVAFAYTVVTQYDALLYLQYSEVTDEVRSYLEKLGAELHPYEEFLEDLSDMRLARDACPSCRLQSGECESAQDPDPAAGSADLCVWFDPDSTSYAVREAIRGNVLRTLGVPEDLPQLYADAEASQHFVERLSPLAAMKAVRNETEIRNFKSCYLEDSAVLTKFIYWLKKQVAAGAQINEAQAAAKLDGMRAEISDYVELSFGTISAYGSNAAMMHYDYGMSGDGGALLRPEGMYLVDSGGHYLRGTTDVTRTVALGPVTRQMRRDYTLTAVSQLRMMETVFMKGCSGMSLDIMAREPMWSCGMDYKCGTGHGIGYLLNVHEGPQNLRWRARSASDEAAFEAGMVISDEPGVYKSGRIWPDGTAEGAYGIRIETILITKEWGTTPDGEFLCFEPLTYVPLDPALIDPDLLAPDTKDSLNRYHAQVLAKLTPFMDEEELAWLKEQCAEIG